MDLAEIQHAIEDLPKEQQTALRWRLGSCNVTRSSGTPKIERDFAAGGAGLALLEEIKADVRAGEFHLFDKGHEQKR